MSGLAVLLHRDGRPVPAIAIQSMLGVAPYRGPDGMSVWLSGQVALGHAKMAVTPEDEREQQPLISLKTGCAIIADVRLDNREELLAQLSDRPMSTGGDASLILSAYEKWGLDAFPRLLGDFAFVIWDPLAQRLVCARDTSGQRSLFYRSNTHVFAASSEIQQLLQDPSVPITANHECIRDSFTPLNILRNEKDQAATFYWGIEALPAGHLLIVDREQVRVQRYWELQPPAELHYRRDEDYAEHYLALFSEVVRARLRSSRPLGVLLSGGLDSASVACTAQELYRTGRAEHRGFVSFSSVFEGLECDERHLIEDIQAKYDLDARYFPAKSFSGRLQIEPRSFFEAPNTGIQEESNLILSAATQAGVRAMLTGDVADSCVGGSPLVFDSLLRKGKFADFRRRLQIYRRPSVEPLHKIVLMACLLPLLPLRYQRWGMSAYMRHAVERDRPVLLPLWMPEPLRQDLCDRHLRLSVELERQRRFSSPARHAEDTLLYPPEVARHLAPWSIEVWRPFADRRLHTFLLAVPPEQKFLPDADTDEFYAGSKQLVRRAMRGIVPESIRTRKSKTIFSDVSDNEIARNWPLYEAVFGSSARSEIETYGYVDGPRFWSRLQAYRAGGAGGDSPYLVQMIALETWLRSIKLPRPSEGAVPSLSSGSSELQSRIESGASV